MEAFGWGAVSKLWEKTKEWFVPCEKKDKKTRKTVLPDLPADIWMNVLSRVSISTIQRCKRVCRAWHGLLTGPEFAKTHADYSNHHHPNPNYRPILLLRYPQYHKTWSDEISLVEPGSGTVAKLQGCQLLADQDWDGLTMITANSGIACFGGPSSLAPSALIHSNNHDYVVGNPLLKDDLMRVPGSKSSSKPIALGGFGLSPRAKRYKIVQIIKSSEGNTVQVCTIGSSEQECSWKSIGPFPYHGGTVTLRGEYASGGVHWLSHIGDAVFIIRLDLDDEQFVQLPGPNDLSPNFTEFQGLDRLLLGVSGGCLTLYDYSWQGHNKIINSSWVMKEYGVWTKTSLSFDCLQSNLQRYSPLFCTAPTGEELRLRDEKGDPNRVYDVIAYTPTFVALKDRC